MRFCTSSWLFVSLFACLSGSAIAQTSPNSSTFIDPRDTLRRQLEDEKRRTLDPQLGTVPYERLAAAREKILNDRKQGVSSQSGIPNITWQERGPNNAAGRARTLLFNPSDAAHKRVWIGTLSGGLWQTNDITDANAGWTPQSDSWENTVVTTIAADPSNPQIVYVGTGDTYTGKAGGGIWKTTTGGASWTRLSSTIPISTGNYPSLGRAFTFIQHIVVNGSGQVFAATQYGVVQSSDGGNTWQFVLAPNMGIGFGTSNGQYYNDLVNDLELASDGVLYASFNPGRVFKSTSAMGTSWTEITPATGGNRTELAVSPATSGAAQVLYAVSRVYNNVNYSQDIQWFKKSTNAGVSWSDVVIPVPYTNAYFTAGNGYQYMDLTAHPTDPNIVYAGGYALFRSSDGGASWTRLNETTGNDFYNQTALQCNPGGNGLVVTSNQGIDWSADATNPTIATPTIVARNNGLRAGEAYSVSMKGSPGGNYLLTGIAPTGYSTITATGVAAATSFYGTGSVNNVTHIDTDEPSIQLFKSYGSVNLYNGSTYQSLYNLNYGSTLASDYDSQSNILYIYNFDNTTNTRTIRRTTGIGTGTLTNTAIPLTNASDEPTFIKLSNDRNTLFVGSYNGKLYKIAGLNQSNPVVTTIDNGSFGANTSISSIDVGATDSELLVTLSNYGVQSVWYTADGGGTWTGKDQTNYGLPDVPVYTALFNPQNRQQMLLGTELGVWTTTNIQTGNPGWTSTGGLPLLRVNQLRYRASDGKIAAATVGRGIWTTDAFAIPYTLPTVTLTAVSNTSLCAGSIASVSFNTNGTFNATNQFWVWISDATGSFSTQRRVGSGTSSPVSFTLPTSYNALPYGTNYQVKIVATNPEVESSPSESLAIGNLEYVSVIDRIKGVGSGQICTGSQATFSFRAQTYNYYNAPIDRYQWLKDGVAVSGAISASYTATQSGQYSGIVSQAGCTRTAISYTLNYSSNIYPSIGTSNYNANQCAGSPVSLTASYVADNAGYQWLKDGATIPGATSTIYVAGQSGRYGLLVQDRNCASTLSGYIYEFGPSIQATIQFDNAADSLACAGYLLGAFMHINNQSQFDSIQWYRNGVALTGESKWYYYAIGTGNYSVMARQGNCQTASNTITRTAVQQIPVSIVNYGNTNLCSGEARTLYAQSANGSSYSWQLNGVDIPGATSLQYTVSSSGIYTVRDSVGRVCGGLSDPISFTFSNALVPKIYVGSANTTEVCGRLFLTNYDNNAISPTLQGYTYQWQKDGVSIANATNSSQYASSTGLYTIRVTNGACTGLSKPIFVNTGMPAKPRIAYTSLEACANNVVILNSVIGGSYQTTQWKLNGVPILNATQYNYYATQSGRYSVFVTYYGCTAESDPIDVKIGEPTAATITGAGLVSAGQTAYLPISFSGPAPWSLTLSNGQSATAVTQNPYLMPASPTATTIYAISSVVNACGTGTTAGNAVVTVGTGNADVSLAMAVSTRTPKVGDVVSYSLNVANAGPTDAAGLQLQSLLPAGVSFLDAISTGITHSNGVVSVAAGSVPTGMTNSFVFRATITNPGTLATAAQVTASQTPDPDSQPNSGTGDGQDDTAQVDLRTADQNGPYVVSANPNQVPLPKLRGNQPTPNPSAVELSLQVDFDKLVANVTQQEVVTATFTVRNRGGVAATGVVVQVLLPNGVALPSQTGWQAIDSQTLNGYPSTIPAGGSATIKLLWRPAGEGTLKAQILDVIETPYASTPGNGYVLGEKDNAQIRIRVK